MTNKKYIAGEVDLSGLSGALPGPVHGLKAETLVASAIAAGYPREDFVVSAERYFERAYTGDIVSAALVEDEWLRSFVRIRLSRPGFYDMLPEGLFFQPAGGEYNRSMGVAEMAAAYRRDKTREKGIRNFFLPFEHAAFFQQLQLDEGERALLQELGQGLLHRYFRKFWDLPEALSDAAAGYFILLIPYAHRICGDLSLMEPCLELLLQEKVSISKIAPGTTAIGRDMEKGLGQQSLGDDMVCGNSFMEEYPAFRYHIGPLDQGNVSAYLPGGALYTVLETFNRFFVPTEASTETAIAIDMQGAGMTLGPGREPILGYSSMLVEEG